MKKLLSIILAMMTLFLAVPNASAVPIFNRRGKVVVLTYHKVSENPKEWSDYCISPKVFEEDLKALKAAGYTFLKVSDLVKDPAQKGKKSVLITFDDGYESDYKYVVPLLEKYGACATFFIFGGALNTPDYLTDKQLSEMSKKPYVEIGNHSDQLHYKYVSTLNIMYNDQKYKNEILTDYKNNGELIEKITGKMPAVLSYPNGIFSMPIDVELRKMGYQVTLSTMEVSYTGSILSPVGRRNRSISGNIQNIIK